MQLIKNKEIIEDTWQVITLDATTNELPEGDNIVSLATWKELRNHDLKPAGKIGVALTSEEDIDEILNDLDKLDLIALEFPIFKNGRHYSSARLLRDRHNFKGEIRAYGDVNRDQLYYLNRVGFDAFQLKADADLKDALNGFKDFSISYQASHDQPLPLYRRR